MEDDSLVFAEQSQSYEVNSCEETLVNELWALRGRCDRKIAEGIAERAHLPLKWIDAVPSRNGEKGTDKLLAERGVLLLRNRTSQFVEQFGHPFGPVRQILQAHRVQQLQLLVRILLPLSDFPHQSGFDPLRQL